MTTLPAIPDGPLAGDFPRAGGSGMVVTQLPHLRQDTGGTLDLISNGTTIRYFDPNGSGGYTERYYGLDTLIANSGAGQYILIDTLGDETTFSDFSSSHPLAQRGTFAKYQDPNANTISVTSYTTDGKPAEIQRSLSSGLDLVTESYLFSYISSGVNAGLMSSAVLRRQTGFGGSWTTVRQVAYTYYNGTESYGDAGDLKLAVVEDASGNALDTTYYRYYTSNTSPGYTDGLHMVFGPVPLTEIDVTFSQKLSRGNASSLAAGIPAESEASCLTNNPSPTPWRSRHTKPTNRPQAARFRAGSTSTARPLHLTTPGHCPLRAA